MSRLNPDAPLFVPARFLNAEDFSPEWWELVKTDPGFRDYWIRERYEGEEALGVDLVDIHEEEAEEDYCLREQDVNVDKPRLVKVGDLMNLVSKNQERNPREFRGKMLQVPPRLAAQNRKGSCALRIQQPR